MALPQPTIQYNPESPVEQAGKVISLRNLAQAGQLQQQQLQGAQLENQQLQQQQQDQQTVMQTLRAHNGDVGAALPELAGKISPQAYMGLAKAHAETREAALKQDNEQLANDKARNDNLLGLIDQAKQLPPEQYAQAWPQIAAQALKIKPDLQGHIDPAQPLPQQALDQYGLGIQAHSTIQAQVMEERKVAAEEWKPAGEGTLVNTRTGETKGTARKPVEEQGLEAYLGDKTIDPGKTKNAATFLAWKAKQSPSMVLAGNMLPQGSALDQAAQRYSQSGELPAGFSRSPGTTAAIIKRAAEMNPDANIAANKATFSADTAALKKVQGQFDQMNAFEGTALRNLDLYVQKARAIPDLGSRFANTPLRMITGKMIGEKNYAALQAARQTAATEAAKVLGSATGAGVLSDTQKKDALDVMDGNLPLPATLEVVNTLKQDFANRHQSYQADIDAIKGRLNPGKKPGDTQSGAPMTIKLPSGKTITIN